MSTPTYNKIRKLATDLRQETKVKARRKLGEDLLSLLTKDDVRRQLAIEATPKRTRKDDPSVAASRCNALVQLWKLVIQGALSIAESLAMGKSKTKLTVDDLRLPYLLLVAYDKPNEAFDDQGLGITKLPKKMVRAILNFCLNMLDNEEAVELAEVQLLEMLSHICSRAEHVGFFKYHSDFENILSEISERLKPEVEHHNLSAFCQASKCLDSLFGTCRHMGIQMDLFLADSMEIVGLWCKGRIYTNSIQPSSDITLHFYGAMASLLFSDPDHAIGPMKRCGRSILSYCKRAYPSAQGLNKDALIQYLLAHLFVSQVAGKIQGLLGGDLGDLGKATLTDRQVGDILNLLMADVGKIISREVRAGETRKRQAKPGSEIAWYPLDLRQRRHLELAARLMASSQRMYLAKVEWDHIEDPHERLTAHLKVQGYVADEWVEPEVRDDPLCPDHILSESPWMRIVVRNLCEGIALSNNASGLFGYGMKSSNNFDPAEKFPILKQLVDEGCRSSQPILSFLPILGACAEAFPAGECWTSTTFNYWHKIPPSDPLEGDLIFCHGCSPVDLGLLVYLLGNQLEMHGGPEGDSVIQSWILVTLTRLTETSSILYQTFANEPDRLQCVGLAWRLVWKTLFRQDLRYHAYTQVSAENTLGGLTMSLLSEIVHRTCTDPLLSMPSDMAEKQASFLHANQHQVWSFHVFADSRSVASTVPFDIVCSIIQVSGLSDVGTDKIDCSLARAFLDEEHTPNLSEFSFPRMDRRKRLLCFAIACLEHSIKTTSFSGSDGGTINHKFAAVVTACIVALVTGKGAVRPKALTSRGSSYSASSQEGERSWESSCYRFTTLENKILHLNGTKNLVDVDEAISFEQACLTSLCADQQLQTNKTLDSQSGSSASEIDIVSAIASRLRNYHYENTLKSSEFSDFVSELDCNAMREFALTFMARQIHIFRRKEQCDSSMEEYAAPTGAETGSSRSLASRTLATKCTLAMHLSRSGGINKKDFESVLPDLLPFLETSFADLRNVSDAREFLLASSDLRRMTQIVLDISSFVHVDVPQLAPQRMVQECKSMLETYFGRTRRGDFSRSMFAESGRKQATTAQPSEDMMFMDDDDDDRLRSSASQQNESKGTNFEDSDSDGREFRTKRTRHFSDSPEEKRRRILPEEPAPMLPSYECAKEIGSVLMILDPSPDNCELVCQALLGTYLDLEPDCIGGDIDLRLAAFCTRILSDQQVLLNVIAKGKSATGDEVDTESRHSPSTPAVMLCRIIELVRSCAGPSSPLYFFGYEESAKLVHAVKLAGGGLKLSEHETRLIVDILKCDDGIHNRPVLRSKRIAAATSAFRTGIDSFHSLFSKPFASFVKMALQDSSLLVRRFAHFAVGTALRFLDERKTVQSVQKLIAPITQSKDVEQFQSWYKEFGFCHMPDDEIVTNTKCADALEVMESDAIFCNSIIAGSTQSSSIFQEALFEIIMVSCARLDLEFACFLALERIAAIRMYPSVETMIELESEGLSQLWLQSDTIQLPLSLTAPSILRSIMISSRYALQSLNEQGLRDHATENFMLRQLRFLVPLAVMQTASRTTELCDPNQCIHLLATNQKLQEICSMTCEGDDFSKAISMLLRRHIADIQGFCYPLLQSEDENYKRVGNRVLGLLNSILSLEVVNSRTKKRVRLIIGRIFEIVGKSGSLAGAIPTTETPYYEAIIRITNECTASKLSLGEGLLEVGVNATENLMRGFLELCKSPHVLHQKSRLLTITLLSRLTKAQIAQQHHSDVIQPGFLIHVLTEGVLKSNLVRLRPDVLTLLKDLLDDALRHLQTHALQVEFAPVIQRLIGACFHVHETCQQSFIARCRGRFKKLDHALRRSRGLVAFGDGLGRQGAWGWGAEVYGTRDLEDAIAKFAATVDATTRATIIGTYEVLEWVFNNEVALLLDSQAVLGMKPPYAISTTDLATLENYDTRFGAQHLALQFIEKQGYTLEDFQPDAESLIRGLKRRLAKRYAWMGKSTKIQTKQSTMATGPALGSLNMDQRLLYAELAQLERLLQSDLRSLGQTSVNHVDGLVRDLSFVCGAPCPEELRIAASRCLGAISPGLVQNLALIDVSDASTDWVETAIQRKLLLPTMQAKCLQSLGECLESPDPKVALVAAETLDALFATKAGIDCWKLVQNSGSKTLLQTFANKKRDSSAGYIPLSLPGVESLKTRAGAGTVGECGNDWCWNTKLWECSEESTQSFESWMCTVTTSIILCCISNSMSTEPGHEKKNSPHEDFFWRCQTMCSLEHSFCSTLFPCLVLFLIDSSSSLYSNHDIGDQDRTKDTVVNEKLSSALFVLINRCGSSGESAEHESRVLPNNKVLSLVVDTIDLLRRVSQYKFVHSVEHARNKNTLPGRPSSDSTKRRQSRGRQNSEGYNDGLPPPHPWRGVPFGMMLNLDELTVARACIQARRFASALFFLDLHLNAQFGKSGGGGILAEHSHVVLSQGSEARSFSKSSGIIEESTSASQSLSETGKSSTLRTIAMMEKCFEELHEYDSLDAIKTTSSTLSFEDCIGGSTVSVGQGNPLDTLRLLNSLPPLASGEQSLVVASCMEDLGFHNTVHSYVEGVLRNNHSIQSMRQDDVRNLREKWFRSSLRQKQWEELPAYHDTSTTVLSLSQTETSTTFHKSKATVKGLGQGFFESLSGALGAFQNDDVGSCSSLLLQARFSILDSAAKAGGGESSLIGLVDVAEKLAALGAIESLTSNLESTSDLLKSWGLSASSLEGSISNLLRKAPIGSDGTEESIFKGIGAASSEFSAEFRELLLRSLYAKPSSTRFLSRSGIVDALVTHLWTTSCQARQMGSLNIAEAVLLRLHSLFGSCSAWHDAMSSSMGDSIFLLRLEEAKLLESRGNFAGAIRKSQLVINRLLLKEQEKGALDQEMQCLLSDAEVSCGVWMAKYKVQQANVVLENYLRPGADRARRVRDIRNSQENTERSTNASLELGQMVSNLYEALSSRFQSVEWKQSGASIAHQEASLQHCVPLIQDARTKRKQFKKGTKEFDMAGKELMDWECYHHVVSKDVNRSKIERSKVEKSALEYLNLAVESFTTALELADAGNHHDLSPHIFRMISLWFAAHKDQRDEGNINSLIAQAIEQIPSFRFVALTNQLFSRIEEVTPGEDGKFQSALQKLVFKLCAEHPYHCLVPIVALSNKKKVGSGVSGRNASAFLENVGNSKVAAADAIITKLKKDAPGFVGGLLKSYFLLAEAYIHLAHAPTEGFHDSTTKGIPFSKVCTKSSQALDQCLSKRDISPGIFTSPPPLRPGADYGDGEEDPIGGERVARFEPNFDLTATGLHRPKIAICFGTKGGKFRQLVKGEDEIRQDAIMNQVFAFVNNLMMRRNTTGQSSKKNRTARQIHHAMKMVTYHVAPLTPASGVLEWVENTAPFGEFLLDRKELVKTKRATKKGTAKYVVGAHSKYFPGEWGSVLCRTRLHNSPPIERRQTFDQICNRHSPVFRFFFVERFGHCMQKWHTAKMKYTRSVALSSVVGHMLGIGDRHTSNILVHQKTAEVVHIDFGIVFEQGKTLNTPERVPFRLTRNMVDGMGPCGTEGTFVRSAEETTRILRTNAAALLTIVSAVADDPLFKWKISPFEARRRQTENLEELEEANNGVLERERGFAGVTKDEDQNKDAAKVISKIHEKLQGYEDSTSGEQQGVEGQVQFLINSARDPDNLCEMFSGWAPWL